MLRPVTIGPDCSLSMPHTRATSAPIPPTLCKIHDFSEPPLPVWHYPPDDSSLSIPLTSASQTTPLEQSAGCGRPPAFRLPSRNGDRATGVMQNAVTDRTQDQGGEAAMPS